MLYLKEINDKDIEKEFLFVRDMPVDENGLTNKWSGITREDFENKALKEMIAFSKGENLPDGFVPETFLFLWNDDEIVGQFRIRHYLCESLRTGGGQMCIRDSGNICCEETIVKGMPEFFKHYDARFCPQNELLTLDYPVLCPLGRMKGVDRIYRYLSCIWLEQKFLRAFSKE